MTNRYGLYTTRSGISYLIQGKGISSLFPDLPCPFAYEGKQKCPHSFDIDSLVDIEIDDPLFQSMIPTPVLRGLPPINVLEDFEYQQDDLILSLFRMSNPSELAPIGGSYSTAGYLVNNYSSTNVGCFIILNCDHRIIDKLERLVDLALIVRRPLVIQMREPIPITNPNISKIKTELTFDKVDKLPLEQIGNQFIRSFMENQYD